MDRKFRIDIICKEFARLWYVLAVLVVVCMAIGAMYSAFIAKSEYTATAAVSVKGTPADSSEGASAQLLNAKANLKTDILSAELTNELNKKVIELNNGKVLKDSEFADVYKITADSNTYEIEVVLDNEKDAVALATFFMDNVVERIDRAKTSTDYAVYNITSTVSDAPSISSYDEPAPIWLTMLIGAIIGVILHIVVSFIVYYTNKKIYDATEFRDTFVIPLVEENFAENGFSNAAIMLSRKRAEGVPFVVALGNGFDLEKVTGGFASLGCRVAVGNADAVAAGANVTLDGEVVANLVRLGDSSKLMDVKNAVSEFKEKFKDKIDILVAVASPETVRKDLFILSDAADATVVKIDLKTSTKRDIAELFEDILSTDDKKFVAAVI